MTELCGRIMMTTRESRSTSTSSSFLIHDQVSFVINEISKAETFEKVTTRIE